MELQAPALDHSTPDRYAAGRPTPAALVSGEVSASEAPHPLSVFDMFRIGIGPSSSHTVGPMRAGLAFTAELSALPAPERISVELFGSLGATGRGHSTDRAVLLGLAGHDPETVSIAEVEALLPMIAATSRLPLPGGREVHFDMAKDIRFTPRTRLPYHVNALTITAWGCSGGESGGGEEALLRRTYYSVGGGFVMVQTNEDPLRPEVASLAGGQAALVMDVPAPHPFTTGAGLLAACEASGLSIAELVRRNEEAVRPKEALEGYLDLIADTMFDCVDAGASASGILPGGLDVPRRARGLARRLAERAASGGADAAPGSAWACTPQDPMRAMDWVTLFALAVNEENAAGHRIVTAPTNGAAGVIPAVLGYLVAYCPEAGAVIGTASGPSGLGRAQAPLENMRLRSGQGRWGRDERGGSGEPGSAALEGAGPSGAASEGAELGGTALGGIDEPGPGCAATTASSQAHSNTTPPASPTSGSAATPSPLSSETAQLRRRAVHDFLLAATAIGALIKTNASIAGAEVGCQGEVGSASAMAAAGLAQALGGTPQQVENAAEIAMEHSLGLTCDPVAGLVQIPCIERNAIAAVKAINAARMALWSDGRHMVSLDVVIETMRQTGNDMLSKYKETSEGGLAVNVVEC